MRALAAAPLAHGHPRPLAAVLAAAFASTLHARRYSGGMNAIADSATSLRGRDLLSVADLSRDEVERLFERAAELKADERARRERGAPSATPLAGRTLAMLFQKPSLRTRVTFEAGMNQLGGH